MSARLVVSFIALTLAGFAGSAAAQTPQGERPRQPAATTQQPGGAPTTTQRRRNERPAGQQTQARPNQPGQTARQSGGLNLDLNGGNSGVPGATRRPGDSFAVSGPYATDAQMQRYTGRRQIQMPRAPIQMFQQDENDSVTGFRRGN